MATRRLPSAPSANRRCHDETGMTLQRRELGRTGIQVSQLCLGSMTWGSQNDYAEAASQIERALELGVNFIDTAEMYPTTPMSADTLGGTETLIGHWFAASGRRDEVVLATKVTGSGPAWMFGGHDISAARMRTAVEGSLKRLRTDRIDLYQLHWPNRGSYHFRQHWGFDAAGQSTAAMHDHVDEVLDAASDLVREGKIRALGLSNESAWGTMQFLQAAERHPGLPRVATVQNEYNLLCRLYDTDMAELSHHEDVGLLAFSPLAAGMLSGKYADGAVPDGSRRAQNAALGGRWTSQAIAATDAYTALAREHGLAPSVMALAFCLGRPFMASVIIGATTMAQLETCLGAAEQVLSDELLQAIDATRREHALPM